MAKTKTADQELQELTTEQAAVSRAIAAAEGLSLAKRAHAVAAVMEPLMDSELEIELAQISNQKNDDDPLPVGGYPGFEIDEEGGEATALIAQRPDRPLDRTPVKCVSYGQRLRRIRAALRDLEKNVDVQVYDLAKRQVSAKQPPEGENA